MSVINRRRFLAITAASMALPHIALSSPVEWRDYAFGAEVSVKLYGAVENASAALNEIKQTLVDLEKQFSLYDPGSRLSSLNHNGSLVMSDDFAQLVNLADIAHQRTNGLFDPTVQAIFEAKLQGATDLNAVPVGWSRVRFNEDRIRLPKLGMALTFNGIAQGFATDKVRQILDVYGFTQSLVNIGEYSAGDRNARIGIADATGQVFEVTELRNQAIATSSPAGYRFTDGSGHILHPQSPPTDPLWDTVSVTADEAVFADAYSTALVLSPNLNLARELKEQKRVNGVVMRGRTGAVTRI